MFVEPAMVPDVYVSDLAQVEDLGEGNLRFTFSTRQKSMHDYAGETENVIVSRLIMPLPTLYALRQHMMTMLGTCACGAGSIKRLRQ